MITVYPAGLSAPWASETRTVIHYSTARGASLDAPLAGVRLETYPQDALRAAPYVGVFSYVGGDARYNHSSLNLTLGVFTDALLCSSGMCHPLGPYSRPLPKALGWS